MPLVATALLVASLQGQIRFDRVDLVSEDPGTWVNYDLPLAPVYALPAGIRFVEQIKPVFTLPWEGWYVGASLASQSVAYERSLLPSANLFWSAGLHTRLLLPRGVHGGLAWRWGVMRLALGVSVTSEATWARPSWRQWSVLPTVGIGVGVPAAPPGAAAP